MKKWQEKEINEVMDNFNFEKVQKVMNLMDWGWGFENRLPSIEELKDTAREYLEEAIEQGSAWGNGSGRFFVFYGGVKNTLSLYFTVDYWDTSM